VAVPLNELLPAERRRQGVDDATRRALQWFAMPVWIGAGLADWWCHRRTDIEQTASQAAISIPAIAIPTSPSSPRSRKRWRNAVSSAAGSIGRRAGRGLDRAVGHELERTHGKAADRQLGLSGANGWARHHGRGGD
jgi:hypothetical protein